MAHPLFIAPPTEPTRLKQKRAALGLVKISALLLAIQLCAQACVLDQDKSRRVGSLPETQNLDIPAALKAVVSIVVYDKSGQRLGQGSGFFVDKAGKLVTNFHVIKDAASATVKSANGAFYSVAGILGTDEQNDLAVLKVSGKDFSVLRLGDSDAVRIGNKVVAIGSPLGLEDTVSDGLISGLREAEGFKVFPTTAAISPGSSGGALLNEHGEVIGITAFQLTAGQNLNFAIPVKYLEPLLKGNAVSSFSPTVNPPETEQSKSQHDVALPPNIPRYWTHLSDGGDVEVRLDGDYLYEITERRFKDGGYDVELKSICESKRRGERWVGKCRTNIQIGYVTCHLELDEIVTSVSPTRIEGEGQEMEPGPKPGSCPQASNKMGGFAYIPKN